MAIQTAEQLQSEIWSNLQLIENCDRDKLEEVNKNFLTYLTTACTNNISTLRADIELPDYGDMGIVTSEGGNLRVYWWDTRLDDIMTAYNAVAQYNDGAYVKTHILNDATIRDEEGNILSHGGYYSSVNTITNKESVTIYMLTSMAVVGVPYVPETITAYTISHGTLTDAKVFMTGSEAYNYIWIEYDQFEALNRKTIFFSDNKEKLYVPELNNFMFTGRYHVFSFDGNNYVFDKNAK